MLARLARWPARRAADSGSRHVRKLAHRQPLPRRAGDRIILAAERLRLVPKAALGLVLFLLVIADFHQYLIYSDYFAISRIEFSGGKRVSESRLRSYLASSAAVREGESLFTVNEGVLEDLLGRLPEVATARVERRWPDSLRVTIEERAPEGIFVTKEASYVYDREGSLFAHATPADFRNLNRPILSGLATMPITRGARLPQRELAMARQYIDLYKKAAPEVYQRLGEVNIDRQGGLTLIMGSGERFLCAFRPPQETGPIVESLLATPTDKAPIDVANLVSDLYITLSRQNPSAAKRGTEIARND